MRLFVKNGSPFTRTNPKDKREIEYLIVEYDRKRWIKRKNILEMINNYMIENGEIRNNSICLVSQKFRVEKINKGNLEKIFKFAIGYLKKSDECTNDYDYDYDYGYDNLNYYFEKLLKEKEMQDGLIKYGYVSFYGNSIGSILVAEYEMNIPLISTVYYSNSKSLYNSICILSAKLKNSVFHLEYCLDEFRDSKFKFVNLNSTINKEKEYNLYHGCYLTEYDENIFVKEIEKHYFPEIDTKQLTFTCKTGKELEPYVKQLRHFYFSGLWCARSSMPSIVGFTYFCTDDMYNRGDNKNFLLAIYKGYIVGVIKFGVWTDHQAVAYIDVNEKYRNKGIATQMIKQLDNYVDKNYTLVLTDESEMGKLCHMNTIFRNEIKSVKVKTYAECLRTGSYA